LYASLLQPQANSATEHDADDVHNRETV
jgi:hypothetical protein